MDETLPGSDGVLGQGNKTGIIDSFLGSAPGQPQRNQYLLYKLLMYIFLLFM